VRVLFVFLYNGLGSSNLSSLFGISHQKRVSQARVITKVVVCLPSKSKVLSSNHRMRERERERNAYLS
jgi:hypothetical protein